MDTKAVINQLRLLGKAHLDSQWISMQELKQIMAWVNNNRIYYVTLSRTARMTHILALDERDDRYGKTLCGCLVEYWSDKVSPNKPSGAICAHCASQIESIIDEDSDNQLTAFDLDEYDITGKDEYKELLQSLYTMRDYLRSWEGNGDEVARMFSIIINTTIHGLLMSREVLQDMVITLLQDFKETVEFAEEYNEIVANQGEAEA